MHGKDFYFIGSRLKPKNYSYYNSMIYYQIHGPGTTLWPGYNFVARVQLCHLGTTLSLVISDGNNDKNNNNKSVQLNYIKLIRTSVYK